MQEGRQSPWPSFGGSFAVMGRGHHPGCPSGDYNSCARLRESPIAMNNRSSWKFLIRKFRQVVVLQTITRRTGTGARLPVLASHYCSHAAANSSP